MQGKNKTLLHKLYNRNFAIKENNFIIENEKVFKFDFLSFYFEGTNVLNTEMLLMTVEIPKEHFNIHEEDYEYLISIETFLLMCLSNPINELSKNYINDAKSLREKAQFNSQEVNENIIRRNGLYYDNLTNSFILMIKFNVPLVNAVSVNSKSAIKAVKELLALIKDKVENIDYSKLNEYISTYKKELIIRNYLQENDYIVFIANGSILPRVNGTNKPLEAAIPFVSPIDMEITIDVGDAKMMGMGIKRGITVITGGGYSGKSTLLNAIEEGIYNHIPGDGREFAITNVNALAIYAEDGRPVLNEDLRPFFNYLPLTNDLSNFSTMHASGSVSQATNIIEAINGDIEVLLIDEDKSATNFMIRDRIMRSVVKREPIIPFTDRVRELKERLNVSTILVIGGSGEYFYYADTILIMEDYICKNITKDIKESRMFIEYFNYPKTDIDITNWKHQRYLLQKETTQPFLFFKTIKTENNKLISLDEYVSDITSLTQIKNSYQINMLASIVEMILVDKEAGKKEMKEIIMEKLTSAYSNNKFNQGTYMTSGEHRWYEEVRIVDILCTINRMRGISFSSNMNMMKSKNEK